jgi:hypothetical protein
MLQLCLHLHGKLLIDQELEHHYKIKVYTSEQNNFTNVDEILAGLHAENYYSLWLFFRFSFGVKLTIDKRSGTDHMQNNHSAASGPTAITYLSDNDTADGPVCAISAVPPATNTINAPAQGWLEAM